MYPLLPRGQATPETLLYLAGCAMLIVAVLLALLSWKPRFNSATEPVVVWRSDEPGLLRDALQTPMFEHLKVDFHEAQAASISTRGIPCTELAQSWFNPVANPIAGSVAARGGVPLACDWTPGEPEVLIIDR